MKKLFFIGLLLAGMATKAQTLSSQQQKDSALHYFTLIMRHPQPDTSMIAYDRLLDQYKVYRTACLSHCKTETEKGDFLSWVVTEWKKQKSSQGE